MRNLIHFGALFLPFLQLGYGFTPSSIETTIYNSQSPDDPDYSNTTRTYFDGLGRKVRTVEEEGAGDIISAIQYDEAGRPVKSVKPYYSATHSHGWKATAGIQPLVDEANAYYDNSTGARPTASGFPFSETQFYPDPLTRTKVQSAPGSAFQLTSVKVKKSWSVGLDAPNFIANPTDAIMDAMVNGANARYTLDVSRTEDNRFTQVIKDNLGRVLKTWSDPSSAAGDEIITENIYDTEGRLIKTLLPGTGGTTDPNMAVTYKYSSDGRLLEEFFPDEGTTKYVYDASGRLRMKQDAKDISTGPGYSYFTYYKYDENGRKIEEGRLGTGPSDISSFMTMANANQPDFPNAGCGAFISPKKRWYYDNLDEFDPNIKIPDGVPSYYESTDRGKVVATIAYNDDVASLSQVMKFYQYDDEGRVRTKTISIPEVPLQQFEYIYDLQGRLIIKFHYRSNGTEFKSTGTDYYYDKKGRMTKAAMDGTKEINYSYETNGKLLKKDIGGMVTDSRTYHIRDWLQAIDVQNIGSNTSWLYREALSYEVGPVGGMGQYGGNISSAGHLYYNGGTITNIGHWYTYDGASRLTSTGYTPEYQEAFTYDSKGRLTSKKENGVTKGPYTFVPNTSRIARSTYDPITTNPPAEYFYDAHGNLIYNRAKMMAIFYDYNNMPYRFRFYKTPPAEGNWLGHTDIKSDVEMLYDADGQRVIKRTNTF